MVSDPLIGMTCFDAFAKDVDVTVMTDRAQRDQLSGNVSDLNAFWLLGFSNFPSGIRGPQRILANFGWLRMCLTDSVGLCKVRHCR